MVPNHLFQLVSLTAMEPPVSFDADAVRDEQAKVLHAIQPLTPEEVLVTHGARPVRRRASGDGQRARPIAPSREVDAHSNTETFVALKLGIDNWRWADVPFYLRTGKRLPQPRHRDRHPVPAARRSSVPRHRRSTACAPNRLVLHIQPDEGISLRFGAKVPGPVVKHRARWRWTSTTPTTSAATPSTGYERLLYDCMIGDATLFQRADMVEAGWEVIEPILDVWKALPPRSFPNYASGSMGPPEAEELMQRDGRDWRPLEG